MSIRTTEINHGSIVTNSITADSITAIGKAKDPLWDGDGVQGAGQPRDRSGRWVKLPGLSALKRVGMWELEDGTFGVWEDDGSDRNIDRKPPTRTYKRKSDANRRVAQDIKEDARLYDENKRRNQNMRRRKNVREGRQRREEHERAAQERDAAVVGRAAQDRQRRRNIPSAEQEELDSKSRVQRAKVESLPNPGKPTSQQVTDARKWAKQNMPENEAKYSEMIARLLQRRGITQDPQKRGELAERYDIPSSRLLEIEEQTYAHMFPKGKRQSQRKRDLTGGSPNVTSQQLKTMREDGAIRAFPYGDNSNRPKRLYKATKGSRRGGFYSVDWNGTARKVDESEVDGIKEASRDLVKREIENVKRMRQRNLERRREQNRNVVEDDILREAQRERRIDEAKRWAAANGLDPDDSHWWGFYWNEPGLVRSQSTDAEKEKNKAAGREKAAQTRARNRRRAAEQESSALEEKPKRRRVRPKRSSETQGQQAEETPAEEEETAQEEPQQTSRQRRTVKAPKRTKQERETIAEEEEKTSRQKRKAKTTSSGKKTAKPPKKTKADEETVERSSAGLPLEPQGEITGRYTVAPKPPSRTVKVRKATKKDLERLFPATKSKKAGTPPPGRENIRVPLGKMSPGYGAFDYMYDHHWRKVKGKVERGKKQRSQSHDVASQLMKFDKIERMAKTMPRLDKRIAKDAKTDDTAAAVAFMRILAMRPSSDSGETRLVKKDSNGEVVRDANGELVYGDPIKTFGATTLKREHVKIENGEAVISLTGKAAHEIRIRTNDKTIVDIIRARYKRAGKDSDKLFDTDAKKTDAYIKETFKDASNKDLRTYVATTLAQQKIETMETPDTVAEFKRAVKEVTETTAAQLQHGSSQSRDSYVSPRVFFEWATAAGVDYELFEKPDKGRARKIKPLGWEKTSRGRRKG